ncbi:MAG: type 4a pilus biogenesis protein PilO [Candidatus Paceibacterota bacterium]|jgi:Tfp pilus assembly protein PilO
MDLKLKTNITLFLFAAASLALVFFLIRPSFLSAKESGQNLLDLRQRSASIEVKINSLKNFETRYKEEIGPDLEKSKKLFINPEDQASFPVLIENTAEKNGLKIDISSVKIFDNTEESEEIWPSLNYQISLTGSFSGISKFIETCSNLPYLIEIHGFRASKIDKKENDLSKEKDAGMSRVQADLSLKVYMQK